MDVSLVMFKADGSRRDFPIKRDRIIVGRTNQCDLRIPLSSVSRQHCELRLEDASLRMRDLGSSNGTFHNHNRVQEVELEAGDKIVIGPVVFTVVIDGKPENIKPVRTVLEDRPASAGSGSTRPVVAATDTSDGSQTVPSPTLAAASQPDTIDLEDPMAALEALALEELKRSDAEDSRAGKD